METKSARIPPGHVIAEKTPQSHSVQGTPPSTPSTLIGWSVGLPEITFARAGCLCNCQHFFGMERQTHISPHTFSLFPWHLITGRIWGRCWRSELFACVFECTQPVRFIIIKTWIINSNKMINKSRNWSASTPTCQIHHLHEWVTFNL